MSVVMGKEASLDGLEFDGDTVLCRVCGDKASGFHYGVHACEGCKGFFRRSIQQKITYRPCLKNQQCNIMRVNRNRCQYCRLKKCIAVGMSRDAVRFGRVPKKEKARIIEQMQKVNLQIATSAMSSVLVSSQDLVQSVIMAHKQTCDLGQEKAKLMREIALLQNDFVDCPAHMACPLNSHVGTEANDNQDWTDFSEFFAPAIKSVVDFAKLIPGFMLLNQDDRVTLLKAATFEVLLVRMACLFDSNSKTMMFANGRLFRRQHLELSGSVGFLLDSMFDFAERFNQLQLSDDELALFSAVVLLSPDRPGVRQVDQVEKIQSKLTESLQNMINTNHKEDGTLFAKLVMKTTDLRTLNALHAEKTVGQTDESVEMQDSQGDTRSEDSTPSDSSSSLATHTSSASGMDISMYDSNGSLGHPQSSSQRFPVTDSPHSQQVVLKTPYGTFYREDTGYYGMLPEQPRRRCHTLDRDSQISRPRLHTIEEGSKRRYTMDREYINKMVCKLSDRLEKRAHVNSMPPSRTSSAASSPVPIMEEYALMNGNRDFIPISTPDSSACSSRTSPMFLKDTLQPFTSSPNSPRPRSGSIGTDSEYGPMRPRCSSFHMNSEGHAAHGRPYSNDYDHMSQEGQHFRMSSDMRRGSVGASYNLHARKKSLLVDRHPAYLVQLPDQVFRKSDKQRSPLASEDVNKHQQIGSKGSAFEQVPRLNLAAGSGWGPSLIQRELPEPPRLSVTAPMDEPQTDPTVVHHDLVPAETKPVISPGHSARSSPDAEIKNEEMYHKKFDKLRKHMIHSTQEETQQLERLSLYDVERMEGENVGINGGETDVKVKEEKVKKSAREAHPQLLAQLKTGPQFTPISHPAFPVSPYHHQQQQQQQHPSPQQQQHPNVVNQLNSNTNLSAKNVVLSVPQTPMINRTSPTLSPGNSVSPNVMYTMANNGMVESHSTGQYMAVDSRGSVVTHLKDKLIRKHPNQMGGVEGSVAQTQGFSNGHVGVQSSVPAGFVGGTMEMGVYPQMYVQQDTRVSQYNQHLAGMQQLVFRNQQAIRTGNGEMPLNLAHGQGCMEVKDRSPTEMVKTIKEEVIS